jgi:HEAT repeat protein
MMVSDRTSYFFSRNNVKDKAYKMLPFLFSFLFLLFGHTAAESPASSSVLLEREVTAPTESEQTRKDHDSKADSLIRAFSKAKGFARSNIIEELRRLHTKRAIPTFLQALWDSDNNTKWEAARALSDLRDTSTVQPLLEALKSYSDQVPAYLTEEIGMGRIKPGEEAVEMSICIIEALGEIGDPSSRPLINEMLKHHNCEIRWTAAEALGRVGGQQSVPNLTNALMDENRVVRESAAKSLDSLNWVPPSNEERTAYLVATSRWSECEKAGADALRPLLNAMESGGEWDSASIVLSELGSSVIDSVINALVNGDNRKKHGAAFVLGRIGEPAKDTLCALLTDTSGEVSYFAAVALSEMGDARAIPRLVPRLRDWREGPGVAVRLRKLHWRAESMADSIHLWVAERDGKRLTRTWERTKRVLLEDVKSSEYIVIENAVYAFVCIGKDEIIRELKRVLDENGTKEMAEVFLNAGEDRLEKAAERWARERGYEILQKVGKPEIQWGEW